MSAAVLTCPRCEFVQHATDDGLCRRCSFELVSGAEAEDAPASPASIGPWSSPPRLFELAPPPSRPLELATPEPALATPRPSRDPTRPPSLPLVRTIDPASEVRGVARLFVTPGSGVLRTWLVVSMLLACVGAILLGRVFRMHDELRAGTTSDVGERLPAHDR